MWDDQIKDSSKGLSEELLREVQAQTLIVEEWSTCGSPPIYIREDACRFDMARGDTCGWEEIGRKCKGKDVYMNKGNWNQIL